jgi:hypothetical protein
MSKAELCTQLVPKQELGNQRWRKLKLAATFYVLVRRAFFCWWAVPTLIQFIPTPSLTLNLELRTLNFFLTILL